MPVVPPLLSRDSSLVSAYADPSPGRRVSRVFLPLIRRGDGGEVIPWASLAARKGEALSANTDLYDLMDRSEASDIHPYGKTSVDSMWQLLQAIGASVPLEQDVITANWIGFAHRVMVGEEVEVSEPLGPWPAGDFIFTRTTLRRLTQIAESEGAFPNYLWTSDHRFVFSCPIYSDSVFVTSDGLGADDFRAVGLEACPVEQDGPLAITGS